MKSRKKLHQTPARKTRLNSPVVSSLRGNCASHDLRAKKIQKIATLFHFLRSFPGAK